MSKLGRVRSIETAAYRSWRARECVEYDGWQLRYADGFSRRGNSVYPALASTRAVSEKLDWCRRWYSERDLDLLIRQTVASESGLDEVLESKGFTLEGRTDVMTVALAEHAIPIEVEDRPSPTWWRTTAGLWGFDVDSSGGWSAIVNRIDLPAGYVAIDGEAAGMAIIDGNWMGLFEVIVDADKRRQGLGTAVTRSLLGWGHALGATQAYLQVVANNSPAIGLYERLGFEAEYSYWYRRDQAEAPKSPA